MSAIIPTQCRKKEPNAFFSNTLPKWWRALRSRIRENSGSLGGKLRKRPKSHDFGYHLAKLLHSLLLQSWPTKKAPHQI